MLHQFRDAMHAARRYGITSATCTLICVCGIAAGHASPPGPAQDPTAQLLTPPSSSGDSKSHRDPTSYCAYELGGGLIAEAINNRNQIVGTAALDDDLAQAFVWDGRRGVRLLGVLPGHVISVGNDVNDREEVVGNSGGAFIWDERNGMRRLATLGGQGSTATHINNVGQIIGLSTTAAEEGEHLYFRDVNGDVVDLGNGIPFGVNDFGQVGFSRQSQPLVSDVFIWHSHKGVRRLRGFPEDRLILPSALNNRKHIVGSIVRDDQLTHAIRWTPGKGMEDLGALGESGFSHATDVNKWGTVVGYIELGFPIRPFIWRKPSGMRDLTTMLDPTSPSTPQAQLIAARAVNDLGWIAINTSDRTGAGPRAFVLTPKFRDDHSPCRSAPPVSGD